MGALALTAKAAYREPFEPLPGDVAFVPYGDVDALAAAVDDTTAAVVLEPVQGEAGAIELPDGYLAAAREITERHGALLWLDEVQCGMGRTGDWFAFSRERDRAGRRDPRQGPGRRDARSARPSRCGAAASLLQPGNHGTTFGGNPVATAAALAVIDTIEAEGLLANATAVGARLRDGLVDHPLVREVSGRGLLLGVGLHAEVGPQAHTAALAAGLIVNCCAPDRLRLVPPLVLTTEQADHAVAVLRAVLDEVTAGLVTRHFLRDDDLTPAEQAARARPRRPGQGRPVRGSGRWTGRARSPCCSTRRRPAPGCRSRSASPSSAATRWSSTRRARSWARARPSRTPPGCSTGRRPRIVWRTSGQERIEAMAAVSRVPVVNALTDSSTPARCSPTCRPCASTRARWPG